MVKKGKRKILIILLEYYYYVHINNKQFDIKVLTLDPNFIFKFLIFSIVRKILRRRVGGGLVVFGT